MLIDYWSFPPISCQFIDLLPHRATESNPVKWQNYGRTRHKEHARRRRRGVRINFGKFESRMVIFVRKKYSAGKGLSHKRPGPYFLTINWMLATLQPLFLSIYLCLIASLFIASIYSFIAPHTTPYFLSIFLCLIHVFWPIYCNLLNYWKFGLFIWEILGFYLKIWENFMYFG